ncbi:MAG: SRPBCC domain-containing protein [Ignavibacteriales bacterium]|nr:SRPBCC domain-containing protein [Ignavibacteriales bacterium]
MTNDNATLTEKKEFVISRILNAPRELVWKAFTSPEHMAQWWSPKSFKRLSNKLELKPGGIYHYHLQSETGLEIWGKFTYLEIFPPEKIVFVLSFSDKDQNNTRHPLNATWPIETLNIVTLSETDGKTTFTLHASPVNANDEECRTFEEGYSSMQQGFTGTFDQLAEYLAHLLKG